jgi:hypothetical protein
VRCEKIFLFDSSLVVARRTLNLLSCQEDDQKHLRENARIFKRILESKDELVATHPTVAAAPCLLFGLGGKIVYIG